MQKLYRPPQGKFSESNLKQASELGYKTVFWSLAYVDWYVDNQPTREEALENYCRGFTREPLFYCTVLLKQMLKF